MGCAAVGFFVVGIVTWAAGLSPFACTQRAVIGAGVVYVTASLAVKAVNAILISAMVESQMKQNKEKYGANKS